MRKIHVSIIAIRTQTNTVGSCMDLYLDHQNRLFRLGFMFNYWDKVRIGT